jgi:hypothetical protein
MTLSLSWMWSYILHRSSFFTLLVDPTPKHHGLREDSGFQTPVCTLYNNLIQCASNTDVNTNHWAFYFSWKFWFSASIVEPETDVFIRCWSTDCTLSIKILHHIFKGLVKSKDLAGFLTGTAVPRVYSHWKALAARHPDFFLPWFNDYRKHLWFITNRIWVSSTQETLTSENRILFKQIHTALSHGS